MAYLGTPIDTRNQFQSLVGKRFNGDGSTTDFTLDVAPSSTLDIEVFVGNVRQDPNSAYTLSGTTLSFTGAPPSGTNNIYVVHQAKSVGTIDPPATITSEQAFSAGIDVNGTEIKLDADADTSITADTDDQIDIRIAGADDFQFTANTFTAQSGSTITTPTLGVGNTKDLGVGIHVKTADSGASVDGNADELVIEGSGQSGITIASGASDKGNIFFADSGSTARGKIIYEHDNDVLRFDSAGSERMNIVETGVQIGNLNENLNFNSSSHGLAVSGNGYASLRVRRGADNGEAVAFFASANNTTPVGNISVTTSSVAYNTSSDYRLKENEVAISDGITRLKTLKPYRFNWKSENDENGNPTRQVDGFIAHEVTAVPEAIIGIKDATETYTDENGNEQTRIIPQGIDQSKLVPLLTSALQEAITKIETLEARVQALEE